MTRAWERFASKVVPDGQCWRWTAARDTSGYGRFYFEGRVWPAHRYAYVDFLGEVPDGLVLDHLCSNRWCVNPWHLDPVPDAVNFERGADPNRHKKAATHCKHGHAFEGRNVIIKSNGCRSCRACMNEAQRRYQAAKQKAVA